MVKTHVVLFFLVVGLGLSFSGGCASPKPPKPPVLPSVADMPPIREYTPGKEQWNTDAICWVAMAEDAKWAWDLPGTSTQGIQWVRTNTSDTIQELIREELRRAGYVVATYENEYITREKRLALDKMVFFTGFEMKKTLVKEGACFDMKLTLLSMDNPNMERKEVYEVWGRCVLTPEETKPWKEIMRMCVANIVMLPEFRQSLAIAETQ